MKFIIKYNHCPDFGAQTALAGLKVRTLTQKNRWKKKRGEDLHPCCDSVKMTNRLCPLPQSLQSSSYNHFSAIYYLLLERVREHRAQQLSRQCGTWSQRPRSTSDSAGPEVSAFTLVQQAYGRARSSSVLHHEV